MCFAPHSLRVRSAPSPRGEGYIYCLIYLASPSGRLLAKRGGEDQKMSFGKKPAAIPRGGLNQCFFIAKIVISIIIIGRAGIIACSVVAVNIIQSV